jgi:hypothetical protein
MITVEIVGLKDIARKYNVNLEPAMSAATFAIGEQLRGILAKYPGPAHSPVIWENAKQRVQYFAERRRRGLPLKYTRQSDPMSQRLGPSWATAHKGKTDATVGTKVTYARWVQSAEKQYKQHKATGWITDEIAIQRLKQSGVIPKILRDAIMHAVSR